MPTGIAKSGKRKCSPRVARVTITCERCGTARQWTPSQAAQRTGRFCSRACASAVVTARPENRVTVACGSCALPITKMKCRLKPTNYCSKKCADLARMRDGAKWRDPVQIKAYMRNYVIVNRERLNKMSQEWKKANRAKANNTQQARRARTPSKYFGAVDWESIKAKYGHCCLACGRVNCALEVDHVVPIAAGGLHVKSNVQPLCRICNARKGAKTIDYRTTYGIKEPQ